MINQPFVNNFTHFFINIGPTLSRSFDGFIIGSPQNYLTNRQISSLFLSPVTNNEIHKILTHLMARHLGMMKSVQVQWNQYYSILMDHLHIYATYPKTMACFLIFSKLQMWSHFTKKKIQWFSATTDQFLYNVVYLKFLRKSRTTEWYHFWMKMMYYSNINLVSVNHIPPTLRLLC